MNRSRLPSASTSYSALDNAQAAKTSENTWLPVLAIVSSLLVAGIWFFQQGRIGHLTEQIHQLQQEIDRLPKSVPAIERLNLQKEQVKLERDRIGAQNGVYNVLFEGVGILLLGGLTYVGWQYLRRTEARFDAVSQQQAIDRFSQAISHLASEKMEVRLGGIYTLERLAQESATDYYWLTIEVLTAFVRERSHIAPEPPLTLVGIDIPREQRKPSMPRIPTDVQAVMAVLNRRDVSQDRADRTIELRGSNLRAADLNGIELWGADLWKVNLREAQLWQAKLAGVSLGRANLSDASLWQADLEGAYLWKANLEGANLSEANLAQANLEAANLRGANLQQTNLINADLRQVVGLTHSQLSAAICDETTQLPEEIERVSEQG